MTAGLADEPELDNARNEPAKRPVDIGQVAYEAYADYVGWESVRGDQLPGYSEQAPRIQNAWRVAASAAAGAVVDCEREPGPFAPTPDGSEPSATTAEEPLPEGEFARIELPGFVQYTGWVTEGIRAGAAVLVIRDWDGHVQAEVPGSALRQYIPLPTPLKRPERREPAAITADPWGSGDEDDYDERGPF